MIIKSKKVSDVEVTSLEDLKKLKPLMDNDMANVNFSQLGEELKKDPRTIKKYINGFEKSKTRNKSSKLDKYYQEIYDLLSSKAPRIFYRRHLYNIFCEKYQLDIPEVTFRYYLKIHPELDAFFKRDRHTNAQKLPIMRYETGAGMQAQLDWKESIPFVLKDTGEEITINIFVLILSYSRYRVYRLSVNKTQDTLFHFLTEAFETFGGVPHKLLTDNMKTVMDESRTEYYEGKINAKFAAFAKDMGFEVNPCISATPKTKAKVEAPMKILDELRAYSGDLDYVGLCDKLDKINNRENIKINAGSGFIPLTMLTKEKGSLLPLPNEKVRNQYKIKTIQTTVNPSSMIVYKGNQYSVPIKYIGEKVEYQIEDSKLYIYSNTKLIALHIISDKKLNYDEEHYLEIVRANFKHKDESEIVEIAKENLKLIGELYDNK